MSRESEVFLVWVCNSCRRRVASVVNSLKFRFTLKIDNLFGHVSDVTCVKYISVSILLSCSKDGTIILWDTQTRNALKKYFGHTGHVNSIEISADKTRIYSASSDGSVKIWDTITEKCLGSIKMTVT